MNRMLNDSELALVDGVVRDVLRLDLPEVEYSFDRVPVGRVADARALALAPAWMLLHSRGRWVVESVEAGSRLYQRLRDQSGEGASTWQDALLIGHGNAYRVSYNGRVWRGGAPDAETRGRVRYEVILEADGRAPGDEAPWRDPWALNRAVLRAHAPAGLDSPEYCTIVLTPKVAAELSAAKRLLADPVLRDRVPQLRWSTEHPPRWGLHRLNMLPEESSTFERDYALDSAELEVRRVSGGDCEVSVVSRVRCDADIEVYTHTVPLQYLLDASAGAERVVFLDDRATAFNGAELSAQYRRQEREWFDEIEDDDDHANRQRP